MKQHDAGVMSRQRECQNRDCRAMLPRLAVHYCPFCGTHQTAPPPPEQIVAPETVEAPSATAVTAGTPSIDPVVAFEAHVAAELRRPYCDSASFRALIGYATRSCALGETRAEVLLEMLLERLHVVNEKKLLLELEGLLHNFTDGDKKLDRKEWDDALQSACMRRPGYSLGLDASEAERFILAFCRRHQVRVKVGLFKWQVP